MNYKILVDSCCDLPKEVRKLPQFEVVPLTIDLNGEHFVDDETFDTQAYIKKMKLSPTAPQSACPSPEDYKKYFDGEEEHIFIVTLSSELSGSYNSAVLAKNLYEEDHPKEKFIHVFNSFAAATGEVLIALKVDSLAGAGLAPELIVEQVSEYISGMNTYFVLETLDNLKKNGRLNNVQALLASVLNIKPVMGSTKEGTIRKIDQARGIKKALIRMAEVVGEEGENLSEKTCAIAHCNCIERALEVKDELLKRHKFKDIIVLETAGISTTYANDGGIIVSV